MLAIMDGVGVEADCEHVAISEQLKAALQQLSEKGWEHKEFDRRIAEIQAAGIEVENDYDLLFSLRVNRYWFRVIFIKGYLLYLVNTKEINLRRERIAQVVEIAAEVTQDELAELITRFLI